MIAGPTVAPIGALIAATITTAPIHATAITARIAIIALDDQYQPRRLAANDRIYRGQDNRYYCRRNDGTTGLIIGGLAGGLLGNTIAPGGSKTLGTILGGGAGALLGRSIDRDGSNVSCR